MTLHVSRSQRVEDLVTDLAHALASSWPEDPLEPVPVVVGSRGMERWLRHELATSLGSIAGVEFVFPGAAFAGAGRWLLGRPPPGDRTAFWRREAGVSEWSGPAFARRVLSQLRAHLDDPAFERVRAYLGDPSTAEARDPSAAAEARGPSSAAQAPDSAATEARGRSSPVQTRELSFALEVSATLERLLHDRHRDALDWSVDPASAPDEHRWLATLLHDLAADLEEPSPAARLAALSRLPPARCDRTLFVFGLSTLRVGDKDWIAELARHLEVPLFALAPSSVWWDDIRDPRAAVRRAKADGERDATLAERDAALADLDRQNVLLATSGAPSREFQAWLEGLPYEEHADSAPHHAPTRAPTLLDRLHEFVDRAADNPPAAEAPWATLRGCPSVEIHACHSALRQCEALADELRRRFVADETLEPRHVLVMTPDLATFGPLVAAVFARHPLGIPPIPVHIADLGLRSTNGVAEALLVALSLVEERITATRLFDLLSLPPVRRRFDLDDEDLTDLRAMIAGAGIRWGWDAQDRGDHEQPPLDQNTVRFGLERLALGVLSHDPGGLAVLEGAPGGTLGPAVPWELGTRDRVARFGKLAEACARVRETLSSLRGSGSPASWLRRLRVTLDALTEVDDRNAWLRAQVDSVLLAELGPASSDLEWTRGAVSALLAGLFDLPQRGDRPITGAVTVSSLEPMRSVPFRVIAILGLDDGAFPRVAPVAAWDPFAARRRGEWDRRTIDRHLFLEAILCARDALLLFGTGFEQSRGEPIPMSVAVEELKELVARGIGLRENLDAVVVRHPLQPWSARGFADVARRPFDPALVDLVAKARGPRALSGLRATRRDERLSEDGGAPHELSATALARALHKPQKELLSRRLGLALEDGDEELFDREPLDTSALEGWRYRELLIQESRAETTPPREALEARLRGEGGLAIGSLGESLLQSAAEAIQAIAEHAAALEGDPSDPLTARAVVAGLLLHDTVEEVRHVDGRFDLVWRLPSKEPSASETLRAWIGLLVAKAAQHPVRDAHLIGTEKHVKLVAPTEVSEAEALLDGLVGLYQRIRSEVVLLFPKLSWEVVREEARRKRGIAAKAGSAPTDAGDCDAKTASPGRRATEAARETGQEHASDGAVALDEGSLSNTVRSAWEGSTASNGDVDDAFVQALFGHLTFDDLRGDGSAIIALARDLYGPLLDRMNPVEPPMKGARPSTGGAPRPTEQEKRKETSSTSRKSRAGSTKESTSREPSEGAEPKEDPPRSRARRSTTTAAGPSPGARDEHAAPKAPRRRAKDPQ